MCCLKTKASEIQHRQRLKARGMCQQLDGPVTLGNASSSGRLGVGH